ncbi:hypothetical protein B0A50_04031 [Salinomyces thailandicus]|uniref:C2H2-type domain-containing protein n=1 Tax=Salinomyces thailandicus TaxID=706561 RepID=A0A4U0U1I5_9PEZI|nr:hypothetical protein B0A50_04031 [Salinomyces thailandica]
MWEPGSESFVELSTTALARSPKAQTLVLKAIRLCNVGPSDGPSNLSVHSYDGRGAIRKRSFERSRDRSVSVTQAERLHQLVLDQATQPDVCALTSTSGIEWITPEHSPQPQTLFSEPSIEPFPTWTVPTPPRSDSGGPSVSVDTNEESVTTSISSSTDFSFDPPVTSSDMSSLGFLLPSQYGSGLYESDTNNYGMDQNYIPPMRTAQPSSTSGPSAYQSAFSSSPALYQSRTVPETTSARRQSEISSGTDSSYAQSFRRISNPYDSSSSSQYSMTSGQTIPSISGLTQSPLPSPHLGANSSSSTLSSYSASLSRSPGLYDSSAYPQAYSTQPQPSQSYSSANSYPPPFLGSSVNEVLAKPLGSEHSIRVLNQRPKPQCWEHGCNGRQFSTFSNLLRHQREKSGTASKSYCPKCGAEFTRTTARNGHIAHDKCSKPRQPSEDDK